MNRLERFEYIVNMSKYIHNEMDDFDYQVSREISYKTLCKNHCRFKVRDLLILSDIPKELNLLSNIGGIGAITIYIITANANITLRYTNMDGDIFSIYDINILNLNSRTTTFLYFVKFSKNEIIEYLVNLEKIENEDILDIEITAYCFLSGFGPLPLSIHDIKFITR